MKNKINGFIIINNNKIKFKNNTGYIEKDWGISFPKSYIWCQGNSFQESNTSFMLSIADILHFEGLICSLIINDKELRFATYNNAKIIKYDTNNNNLNITLKKGHYYLNIKSKFKEGFKLSAPINGEMKKDILESINETITLNLKKDDIIIFKDTSTNCGLEIIKENVSTNNKKIL